MSASTSTNLFGLLLATCLVSSANALELGQPSAPDRDAPAIELPAFLDLARLPDLQEAWRAHFAQPQATPEVAPAIEQVSTPAEPQPAAAVDAAPSPDPASDAAIQSARATLARGEQASRDADSVRMRAEELSSKFGAGSAASPAADAQSRANASAAEGGIITTGSVSAPETETGTEAPAATAETAAPANAAPSAAAGQATIEQAVEAPAKKDAETETAKAEEGTYGANDKLASRTLMRAGLPPSTVRPSTSASRQATDTQATSGVVVAPKAVPASEPMPMELRAFGWNSQP